jgi:hypothetical protein
MSKKAKLKNGSIGVARSKISAEKNESIGESSIKNVEKNESTGGSLPKNSSKKASIFVATPMYGGMCTGHHAIGLANIVNMAIRDGIPMHYAFMMNESLITRARDSLAHDFLKSEFTHMLFVDADIGFNANDIPKMLEADKDIICGLYPKKEINWHKVQRAMNKGVEGKELERYTGEFVVRLVDAKHTTGIITEPLEIECGGTGFMLISRRVFEGLLDKVPTYTSDMFVATDIVREKKIIHQFFDTSICPKTNNLLSEDYHFCALAREHGFKIYAAPWVKLSHTGTYTFAGEIIE